MTTRKKHSVSWLERELTEARKDLQLAGNRLNDLNAELAQRGGAYQLLTDSWNRKNDELVQARNERDAVRDERDEFYRALRLANAECAELRKDLQRLRDAHTDLTERNRVNFDKARRSGDVAAVLVSCLVAATGEDPAGTMLRFVEAFEQMGIDPDVINEVQNPLKRGYNAQVERIVGGFAEQLEEVGPGSDDLDELLEDLGFPNSFLSQ